MVAIAPVLLCTSEQISPLQAHKPSDDNFTFEKNCNFHIPQSGVGFAGGAKVDAELLAFLVEMAALEAEGAGGVGHVMVVALELGEKDFALEGFDALGEGAGGCPCGRGRSPEVSGRPYRQMHMIWRLQGLWQYLRGDVIWQPKTRIRLKSKLGKA